LRRAGAAAVDGGDDAVNVADRPSAGPAAGGGEPYRPFTSTASK
jgi:hypothetical protein